ncbi:hypothetical protein EFY76_25120 [Salmonella enterica]|uniref:Uncharacterized protein n=1 Tax=Salmonella enterica TaxID=28901 RepID=A0A5T2ME43_SALER|nr:hypothetical protein [Salmonella enterica]EIM2852842.1 hypothetical protein [Salmonella enterica]EIP1620576.1 hypothetical protein [Salmonella enterica]ELE3269932.1 hypothetical protein [Salmonella enterica subsp. enterica serovar Muenchen]
MNSFFERYKPVFEIVARLLGNGWRVNRLDDCQYRIKLTTHYNGYGLFVQGLSVQQLIKLTGSIKQL